MQVESISIFRIRNQFIEAPITTIVINGYGTWTIYSDTHFHVKSIIIILLYCSIGQYRLVCEFTLQYINSIYNREIVHCGKKRLNCSLVVGKSLSRIRADFDVQTNKPTHTHKHTYTLDVLIIFMLLRILYATMRFEHLNRSASHHKNESWR